MVPKILIADDYPDTRSGIIGIVEVELGELGKDFEVVEADDGRAAIEAIRNAESMKFDLVMTDLNMPYNDGIDVVNVALDANIPDVVLATARDLEYLHEKYGEDTIGKLKKRGLRVLRKPCEYDVIVKNLIDPLRKRTG